MSRPARELRFDVFTEDQLRALLAAPLPLGLPARAVRRRLHRDLYLDTPDDSLRRRGACCRLRLHSDGRRELSLRFSAPVELRGTVPPEIIRVRTAADDAAAAMATRNAVTRRVAGIVDPARLDVRLTLEHERFERFAGRTWLGRPAWLFRYDLVTVREGNESRAFQQLVVRLLHGRTEQLDAAARDLRAAHGLQQIFSDTRERGMLLHKWIRDPAARVAMSSGDPVELPGALPSREWPDAGSPSRSVSGNGAGRPGMDTGQFLNSELSLLEFIGRVLALAEDLAVPLRERLRYLAIVASNLDEFFMIRVAGLKHAVQELVDEHSEDGLTPQQQLELIALRVPALVTRHARCAQAALAELGGLAGGVRVCRWDELPADRQSALRERVREEIHPELTPLAVTLSPGHPIPRLPHLSLALAATIVEEAGGHARFVNVELPERLPRFLAAGDVEVVPVEEAVRANLDILYPGARVESAHLFRVTRAGDLALDERRGEDLLDEVAEATKRRPFNPVVRIEVEAGMPATVRAIVLEGLRRERGGGSATLGAADVHEVDGLLDLRDLADLPVPEDPALEFPPFQAADPFPGGTPIWDLIRERDRLVHHPFESFDASVVRFLREAAEDPAVSAIKITLYRTGDESPVAAALLKAASHGKDVVAFVELKARFDEERNVGWARKLEKAGGRVVYGLVGLKTHAKLALVVRRENGEGRLRRYVHVGTGNYNTVTGRRYTDLSLFSADESLAGDMTDLFNELTGSSRPPAPLTRGALIAPLQLRRALVERIAREAVHARAGRPAGIRMKTNGLSDPEIVRALYDASRAGVRVELIVRGLCTLRPGVPGVSDHIRVVSAVGRFLEHSRVYRFENGGAPEYFMGSADLRPRNLRRRVELLVPVREPACRAVLDRLFEAYLTDDGAWQLTPHGAYARPAHCLSQAQLAFLHKGSGVP